MDGKRETHLVFWPSRITGPVKVIDLRVDLVIFCERQLRTVQGALVGASQQRRNAGCCAILDGFYHPAFPSYCAGTPGHGVEVTLPGCEFRSKGSGERIAAHPV